MPEPPVREIKVKYRKSTSFWMTVGVVLFLLLLNIFSVFESLENKTIDLRFNLRGVRHPTVPVKIIGVDEKSLAEIGRWPWPRATEAQLVRKLKADGVRYIVYDMFFPEPEKTQEKMLDQLQKVLDASMQGKKTRGIREKVLADVRKFQATQDGDQDFADAIKEAGNVFLPIEPLVTKEGSTPEPDALHMESAVLADLSQAPDFVNMPSLDVSIPKLQKNVVDSGHTITFPYSDGIYRYVPTVFEYDRVFIPHLMLQVARHMVSSKAPLKVHTDAYAEVGDKKIPILERGFALINYCGPAKTFPTYSASDVLEDKIGAKELKDSVVLIGATAPGLFDIRPNPFIRNFPGVETNANVLENALTGNFLHKSAEDLKYLLVILMAFLMWYLVPKVTPIQGTFVFILLLIVYCAVLCAIFDYMNIVVPMFYPSIAMVLTFLVLTTYKFRTEVKHSRYMKQMFQSMVAPSVVEEILKLPAGIELGGEEKTLTVMFSDVRGFTTYSEKHTPHDVVEILNEYLTQMTYLVFQTEGTLDKYIGDAIMAFWGAPTTQQDHAYRACSTALGMVDLLHNVLHPKWELEGKEKLEIGVGLNTGPMVVGFVGSESIKSYTLIGDAVNLGSRLEGTTKEYHVEIIISETTYDLVKSDMLCRELDLIKVKGKNEPIRIYELVDHRLKGAGAKEMKVKAFEEGLALYRQQKWDEAVRCFKNCLDLDPKDGPAGIFIKRCDQLRQSPPGVGWDGVFVMKTK